ncbi:hypothetical protein NPIL_398641 [Nephila pilipes]|uniref:Uncharacterized protein n=1 Tax=Nephila pilipes TaxID=299642 RepID=A0A8X6IRH5_NEPPI|nr:hypothetical protein NPIL_398641 [Nephila pilipes]
MRHKEQQQIIQERQACYAQMATACWQQPQRRHAGTGATRPRRYTAYSRRRRLRRRSPVQRHGWPRATPPNAKEMHTSRANGQKMNQICAV